MTNDNTPSNQGDMTMSTITPEEAEAFRHQAEMTNEVLQLNVEGLTHEESLVQPRPGGNCLNWVVGHLLWTYDYNLPVLEQEPVMGTNPLKRYERGSAPLRDPTEAMGFQELLTAWDEASRRMDAGLASLTADVLDQPAQRSPDDDPDETVRERLTGVLFHQSYHVGQTALLRRIAGREGAVG